MATRNQDGTVVLKTLGKTGRQGGSSSAARTFPFAVGFRARGGRQTETLKRVVVSRTAAWRGSSNESN